MKESCNTSVTGLEWTFKSYNANVARRLAELKHELQYDEGFAASEATVVAIVSAWIMNTNSKQVAKLLKKAL